MSSASSRAITSRASSSMPSRPSPSMPAPRSRARERDRLIALGAHHYLVFMADLCLNMDRKAAAFEHF